MTTFCSSICAGHPTVNEFCSNAFMMKHFSGRASMTSWLRGGASALHYVLCTFCLALSFVLLHQVSRFSEVKKEVESLQGALF